MTKRLDPEIKALRAMVRAWQLVPTEAQKRALDWFCASTRAKIRRAASSHSHGGEAT